MKRKLVTKNWPLHLMLLPGIVVVLIYQYGPMFGLTIAFQNFIPTRGIFGSDFVGLDNFRFVFSLPDIWQIIWNTFYIAIMKVIVGLIAPIVTALLLNELRKEWFKRGVQTLIYLPHFLSWVILGGILIDILSPGDGIINRFLGIFDIGPIYFLGDNNWFPYSMVISDSWKEFGYSTIVYLAALTGISPELYEAASIDGASHWRKAWHITIPGMRMIIVLLATLSLGNVLNAGFEQILVMYSPQVYQSGDIIDTVVYRMGLLDAQYSFSTAIGLMKSLVSLILISISYWAAVRFANYRIF